jgi:hypothetical protein
METVIEQFPEFTLESKYVEQVRDLRVLGIYTYVKMMISQGEYTVCVIVDKMKEQFFISDKEMIDALKIIIEDLQLLTMVQEK